MYFVIFNDILSKIIKLNPIQIKNRLLKPVLGILQNFFLRF